MNQGFDLEALIRTKDFHELSFEERAEVLSEVSEREYQQMRELVVWSGELLKETHPSLNPRADIRRKLNQRFKEKKERKIIRMLQAPVPVWKVAAAMVVLLVSIQFFGAAGWLDNVSSQGYGPFIADSTNQDTAIKVHNHTRRDSIYATYPDSL